MAEFVITSESGTNAIVETGTTVNIVIDGAMRGPAGSTPVYTNLTPVPVTLGGITAGTTFSGVELTDLIDDLLYPYLTPTFSSFTITGQSTSVEVGTSLSGSKTFTWASTNTSNVEPGSVYITQDADTLASSLSASGSTSATITTVTKTSPGSQIWVIRGVDTNEDDYTSNFTVNWLWRVYVGTSTNATLTEAQIEGLASNSLASTGLGTYSMAAGGYKYFCWPATLAAASGFTDTATQLNVSMATSSDNAAYSNTANGLSYALVSVTNTLGVTTDYRVYRSRNQLGGSVNVRVT